VYDEPGYNGNGSGNCWEKCKELGQYFTIEIKRDRQDGRLEMKYETDPALPYTSISPFSWRCSPTSGLGPSMLFDMKGRMPMVLNKMKGKEV
jgi:hypothetical protein